MQIFSCNMQKIFAYIKKKLYLCTVFQLIVKIVATFGAWLMGVCIIGWFIEYIKNY